jgi:hypothetical protein
VKVELADPQITSVDPEHRIVFDDQVPATRTGQSGVGLLSGSGIELDELAAGQAPDCS